MQNTFHARIDGYYYKNMFLSVRVIMKAEMMGFFELTATLQR